MPGAGPAGSGAAAAEPKGFMPAGAVDRVPRIITPAPLRYPEQARRNNLEATVTLEADIDAQGRVVDVRVVKPAGFGFDEAAAAYVRGSVFSPAFVGATAVGVRMRILVVFTLTD